MRDLGGHPRSRQAGLPKATLFFCSLILAFFLLSPRAKGAPTDPAPANPDAEVVLLLELDEDLLSDSFVAVERSGRLFVPICPIAEAISLAISCVDDRAFGFLLEQSRPFAIDLKEGNAIAGRRAYPIKDAAFMHGGDLVVDAAELSKWLPVEFNYKEESSTLHLHARELLPVQGLRKRQKFRQPALPLAPRQYEDFTLQRKLSSVPTLDLTSQLAVAGDGHDAPKSTTVNTLSLSGDLLYLSGEAHLSAEDAALRRLDFTLSRRSEAGFKLGPVPVTQLLLGTSQVPNLEGIGAGSAPMYGFALSNRPLAGATRFLTHDIDGYLPAGWDAELFYNGTPIGYQPPTQDGMYHFQNLKVQYGINNFKLILHGPFGETRESEQSFYSDATTPTGEFLYSLSGSWQTDLTVADTTGPVRGSNLTLTSDFGVLPGVAGSALAVRQTDNFGVEQDYAGLGARTALGSTLLSLDFIQSFSPAAGKYGQLLEVRSSSRDVFGVALQVEQRFFRDFDSPRYPASLDPLLSQSHAKLNSSFSGWNNIRFPLSLEIGLDTKRSGEADWSTVWRGGGGWRGWNGALEADVSYLQKALNASGSLQVSTRVQDVSVRGQIGYTMAPELAASVINLSADKDLGGGYLLNSGLVHNPAGNSTGLLVGLSKKFGLVGYSVSATGSTTGAYGFSVGLSSSLAADRYNRQAVISAEALSPSGMITVSATAAAGSSPGKELPGIGFLVNGSHALTVTGTRGAPVIAFLRPDIPVDITIDLTTVEDPFMVPKEDGCHITPRAGVISFCRFTMVTGGEIDGMVLVRLNKNEEVPLKGVRLGLAGPGDSQGAKLLASTQTEESGYYVFKGVRPGNYQIVIPEEESARLKTAAARPIAATMPEGGDQISGKDFMLEALGGKQNGGAEAKGP
jgi:hypothetical protein